METLKKSRGYFPDTEEGQKEYEKQWDDSEFDPCEYGAKTIY